METCISLRPAIVIKNVNQLEVMIIDEILTNPFISQDLRVDLERVTKDGDSATRQWFGELLAKPDLDKEGYLVLGNLLWAWGMLIEELHSYLSYKDAEEILNHAKETARKLSESMH